MLKKLCFHLHHFSEIEFTGFFTNFMETTGGVKVEISGEEIDLQCEPF